MGPGGLAPLPASIPLFVRTKKRFSLNSYSLNKDLDTRTMDLVFTLVYQGIIT